MKTRATRERGGRTGVKIVEDCSVANFFVRILVDYCAARGLSARQLLGFCCRQPAELEDPDARFPYLEFLRLCQFAAERLADPCLGIHLGEQMKPAYLGPYGFALISCSSGREMLAQAARYSVLAIDVGVNVFEERDDVCIRTWRHHFTEEIAGSAILDELVMSSWLVMMRLTSGREDLAPRWVAFKGPEPATREPYELLFRCPVVFGAEDYAIAFDRRYLDVDVGHGHPQVRASLDALCESLLARHGALQEPQWLADCRRLIVAVLGSGAPELGQIAAQLGVSPGTLRVRLASRATSFRRLVDEIRHELALGYLQDASLSLVDVAYLLGFSEQSAFQRAFKRWAGMTPGAHRRRLAHR